jgi:4-hydroxy-2-oxoheptanedioate aldolase
MTDIPSLRTLWAGGSAALGAWIGLRDLTIVEIAATAGFDYVSIDMQHGLADFDRTVDMLHAIARTPAVPVVRVPGNDANIIGRVLDAGAMAVIIPMVNSADEARRAVEACRYAPSGKRSFGPMAVAARHGAGYVARAGELVACIPMIETREAIDNVEEILAVPGVDAVYVGPADLSITLGLSPGLDQTDSIFTNALDKVLDACRRHDVVPGIHANAQLAPKRHAAGFRMITCAADMQCVSQALRADLQSARHAIPSSS